MAGLGIALAGAAIAGSAAAAAGATAATISTAISIGMTVGSMIAQLIFQPDAPDIVGPRLGDTRVQTSSYGAMIPLVHGTVRVAGNIIAMPAEGIREVRKEESVGGKGAMGGGQTVTSFTYFATMEIALCEGPIQDVIAIWADQKLIFDTRSTVKLKKKYKKMQIRVRLGNETQLPDPIWEAEFGVGEVPAGRGVASLVIEDLPLADFGNRIPNISAIVARSTTTTQEAAEHWDTASAPQFYIDNWMLDRDRNVIYALGPHGVGDSHFIKYDALTGRVLADGSGQPDLDNIPGNGIQYDVDDDGFLYCAGDPNGDFGIGQQTMVKIDPNNLSVIATGAVSAANPTGDVLVSDEAGVIFAVESGVLPRNIHGFRKSDLEWLWTTDIIDLGYNRPRRATVDKNGVCWLLTSAAAPNTCIMLKVTSGGVVETTFDLGSVFDNETIIRDIAYWRAKHKLVIGDADRIAVWDIETETLGQKLDSPITDFDPAAHGTYRSGIADDGTFAITESGSGQGWHVVDLNTDPPTLLQSLPVGSVPTAHSFYQQSVYEAQRDVIISSSNHNAGDDQFDFIPLDRQTPTSVLLSDVVKDICEHAGLDPDVDVDVSDFDAQDLVNGYVIARQGTGRAWLQPLAQAYFFDGYNGDAKIKFIERGRAIDHTFSSTDDLAAHEPEQDLPPDIVKSRTQETEVPKRVTIKYMDLDRDYEEGAQSDGREVTDSVHELQVEFTLALTATRAKQIATVIREELNIQRDGREIRVGPKYIDIDPTDVISVEELD